MDFRLQIWYYVYTWSLRVLVFRERVLKRFYRYRRGLNHAKPYYLIVSIYPSLPKTRPFSIAGSLYFEPPKPYRTLVSNLLNHPQPCDYSAGIGQFEFGLGAYDIGCSVGVRAEGLKPRVPD